MKTTRKILLGAGAIALATPAYAQEPSDEEPSTYSYAWSDPRLQTGIGVGVIIGGGVGGFTDATMRDTMRNDVGGLWSARLSIGTHTPLGLDISYVGTASELQTLGISNGTLLGTNVETALRWNILPHYAFTPYVFGGIGWQRYNVVDESFSLDATGMRDEDDLIQVPLGAGVSWRDTSGLVADVRGTVRVATESSLLIAPDGDDVPLHTWEASAALGYEF